MSHWCIKEGFLEQEAKTRKCFSSVDNRRQSRHQVISCNTTSQPFLRSASGQLETTRQQTAKSHWPTERVNNRLTEWLTNVVTDGLTHWPSQMAQWVGGRSECWLVGWLVSGLVSCFHLHRQFCFRFCKQNPFKALFAHFSFHFNFAFDDTDYAALQASSKQTDTKRVDRVCECTYRVVQKKRITSFIFGITSVIQVMWSHNKGAVGGKTTRLCAINFCL